MTTDHIPGARKKVPADGAQVQRPVGRLEPKRAKRRKPLLTRLRSARILLRDWRRSVYDSERDRTQQAPNDVSPEARGELARFDAADEALKEVIRSMEMRYELSNARGQRRSALQCAARGCPGCTVCSEPPNAEVTGLSPKE